MFLILLTLSIVWVGIFIASAAFDAWFEICRPRFFVDNAIGRTLAVVGIAPVIITLGITALVALPIVAFWDQLFRDPWDKDSAWLEVVGTLNAAYDWFTKWAPAYVLTGEE